MTFPEPHSDFYQTMAWKDYRTEHGIPQSLINPDPPTPCERVLLVLAIVASAALACATLAAVYWFVAGVVHNVL